MVGDKRPHKQIKMATLICPISFCWPCSMKSSRNIEGKEIPPVSLFSLCIIKEKPDDDGRSINKRRVESTGSLWPRPSAQNIYRLERWRKVYTLGLKVGSSPEFFIFSPAGLPIATQPLRSLLFFTRTPGGTFRWTGLVLKLRSC